MRKVIRHNFRTIPPSWTGIIAAHAFSDPNPSQRAVQLYSGTKPIRSSLASSPVSALITGHACIRFRARAHGPGEVYRAHPVKRKGGSLNPNLAEREMKWILKRAKVCILTGKVNSVVRPHTGRMRKKTTIIKVA